MKTITENEFKSALKIVDAYFNQVNKEIKEIKSKEIINRDLMISRKTRLVDLPSNSFNISCRLLNALHVKNYYDDNNRDMTVGWLENINIKSFCAKSRNTGEKSGTELRDLCDKLGINYVY